MWILRQLLHGMEDTAAIEFLIDKLKDTKTNADFFDSMKGSESDVGGLTSDAKSPEATPQ